jgi:hypothetical protein
VGVVTVEELILDALRSPSPDWALRGVTKTLLAQGHDRDRLVDELLRLQTRFQETGQEREEDVLIGVMDTLTGWCAPDWRL